MKRALVCGAGGFIGHHLVNRLKKEGYWVRGVDIKYPEFAKTSADDFMKEDLRDPEICMEAARGGFDEIYQLAADMGGAGYVFSEEHDADIMHNSALININMAKAAQVTRARKMFYSSSACIYPSYIQKDPNNSGLSEESAYPAFPDSEYGWEKLFSERLYFSYHKNYKLEVRVARFHNIFGPEGAWDDGREKAPAAICRKVAEARDGDEIEIWGDGEQTRSFLFIDECVEAVRRFMDSGFTGPINIGSEEMVSINQLAAMIMKIAGKKVSIKHIGGPLGVRGRNSDNRLILKELGWKPSQPLAVGLEQTYKWIERMVREKTKLSTN